MIINTGSRTDIPAYYSEWFYNRVREGDVMVRNPYYPDQITRYRLSPDVVDLLVFCTKNPEPMLSRLDELSAFRQFWYVTITPMAGRSSRGCRTKSESWKHSSASLRETVSGPRSGATIRSLSPRDIRWIFMWSSLGIWRIH